MKLTTWNAEWLDYDWGVISGKYDPGQKLFGRKAPDKSRAEERIRAIGEFITSIDPDILFVCEAPKGESAMKAFVNRAAPDYKLVSRGESDKSYEIQGRQWLWFLVRKSLADRLAPKLVPVKTCRAFAAAESSSISEDGKWHVTVPRFEKIGEIHEVSVANRTTHSFYREPQVLSFRYGGSQHEIIGAHLKSKYTETKIPARDPDKTMDEFVKSSKQVRRFLAEAHEARAKLSSEAAAIRAYIEHRFRQEADPSILVVGDLNDGPGKEFLEREFLLHDLISNLQGDVSSHVAYSAMFWLTSPTSCVGPQYSMTSLTQNATNTSCWTTFCIRRRSRGLGRARFESRLGRDSSNTWLSNLLRPSTAQDC